MKYVDEEGTVALRSRVGDTVSGVLVRDGAAMDRLISKIEIMAEGDVSLLSLSPGLTELIKSYPEEARKRFLQASARLSSAYLQSQGEKPGGFSWSPEILWKEIERLALPMEENNIVYQILDEILQPLSRVDDDLTRMLRKEMGAALQPVERSIVPGDVLVEKGQIITDQAARILEMRGYSRVSFPWKQILFALVVIPFWLFGSASRRGITAAAKKANFRGSTSPLSSASAGLRSTSRPFSRPGDGEPLPCRMRVFDASCAPCASLFLGEQSSAVLWSPVFYAPCAACGAHGNTQRIRRVFFSL